MYMAALVERIDRLNFYMVCVVAFNIVPYAICLILAKSMRPLMALCAAVLLLIVDVWLYNDIIAVPGFSLRTFVYSAVITMYAPLWKMALVLPAGWLVGLMIDKRLH